MDDLIHTFRRTDRNELNRFTIGQRVGFAAGVEYAVFACHEKFLCVLGEETQKLSCPHQTKI
ncbi:hypothetical protein C7B76_31285 [filamentous cyanobacterium CCP2]|nr:hypothetical protein C7B76_31285 [filamentous cyanobacterium CCP2]